MDKHTDYVLTSQQGTCDSLSNKIYYLNECPDKSLVGDNHKFVIRKDGSYYILDSIINEDLSLNQDLAVNITSVCTNNNSEVETVGNVENKHTVNQGDNSSFDYTFKRYYSTSDKMSGCQYESSIKLSLVDMFDVVQNGDNVKVVSKNAEYVNIDVSELDIIWRINDIDVDMLDGETDVDFNQEALARYTNDDTARISVLLDGVRFKLSNEYSIDRNQYNIKSVSQTDYIDGLTVRKDFTIDYNYQSITAVVLFIDDAKIQMSDLYDSSKVEKDILAVMYKSDEPEPIAPFEVSKNGVVFIKTVKYEAEAVSESYLQDGYFDLSSEDGSISGTGKSMELPVKRVTNDYEIKNFYPSSLKFFSQSKQLLFDSTISPDGNGGVLVKDELGNLNPYRLEDLIATELVFEDQEEKYIFLSKSSFEANTYWDIPNIDDITFEIDSGRVYGDNLVMTYDADQNEVSKLSLTMLWLESVAGSEFRIYGIDENGTEILYVLIKNLTAYSSSIFNSLGTKILNFDMYRYLEFVEFNAGTKKIRIESSNSNIMFENLQITLKRG